MFEEVAELKGVFLVTGLLLATSACTTRNPRNCDDGICTDPAFPYCDADGSVAGTPHVCIEASCEAGVIVGCQGNGLLRCNSDGTDYEVVACSNGCDNANGRCNDCVPNTATCSGSSLLSCGPSGTVEATESCALSCAPSPSPHCVHIEPRYLADVCNAPAANADFTVTSSGTLDTGLDSNCNGGVVAPPGAPGLCVLRYNRIAIPSGRMLKVTGTRAIAFVADTEVTIGGLLDVSADQSQNGPGGGATLSGASVNLTTGGGGAGFHTIGGNGGNPTSDGGGGAGGAATANPALLAALVGGPQSGATTGGLRAGGGGGALTLVSCKGTVEITGIVDAGGGGGGPGVIGLAGRGAGAGGYVVVQAAAIRITGEVYANGGGGGGGQSAMTMGLPGEDGSRSATRGAAGGLSLDGSGQGGYGGYQNAPPGNGLRPTVSGATAGGGGAANGFLQLYTPQGVSPMLTPTGVSPPFEPNATIPTR